MLHVHAHAFACVRALGIWNCGNLSCGNPAACQSGYNGTIHFSTVPVWNTHTQTHAHTQTTFIIFQYLGHLGTTSLSAEATQTHKRSVCTRDPDNCLTIRGPDEHTAASLDRLEPRRPQRSMSGPTWGTLEGRKQWPLFGK